MGNIIQDDTAGRVVILHSKDRQLKQVDRQLLSIEQFIGIKFREDYLVKTKEVLQSAFLNYQKSNFSNEG